MTSDPVASSRGRLLRGTLFIAVAMGVMNLSTYGFTMLAARLLGPREYGAIAAVMGVLLVVSVVSLGLQATGARRVSAAPGVLAGIEADVLAASHRAAMTLGVLCLLAVPVVTVVLRLDSWLTAVLIAVTAVPMTLMGGQAGILQGERRWLSLAAVYLAVGLGRIVLGTAGLLVRPDTLGGMLGVTLGAVLPALVGWAALRHPGRRAEGPRTVDAAASVRRGPGGVFREVAGNSHAMLAFFALSNADVLIARSVLDDQQGGLYAGGLILAKAVLFLPQFVVVIAFPSMSEAGSRRRVHGKGFALVLGIGGIATVGAWLLSGLAVTFVGGAAYAELEPAIAVFAAVGTVLALVQLMVYGVVARQDQRSVLVLWAGLLAVLASAAFVDSVGALLTVVVVVESVVLTVLLAISLRRPLPRPHRATSQRATV